MKRFPLLLSFLFAFLAFAGANVIPANAASDQGVSWTVGQTVVFTGQPDTTLSATPGNTTNAGNTGTLTDVSGNNWQVVGGLLLNPGNNPGGGTGSGGFLTQSTAQTALNQRIIVKYYVPSGGFRASAALRINTATTSLYNVVATDTAVAQFQWNNYSGGGASPIGGSYGGNYTSSVSAGHYVLEDASVVSNTGHTSSTVATTVTDLGTSISSSTGTVVYTATSTADTSASVQGAGQIGLSTYPNVQQIVSIQFLNNGSPTPPALSAGTPNVASTAPGQAVLTSTAGAGGTGPYTYALYRNASPLFTPGAAGTLVGLVQSALSAAPANVTDTAPPGKYWYRWLITDSVGATSVTPAVYAVIPDVSVKALLEGSSTFQGDTGGTVYQQYAALPVLSSGGTGYTHAAIAVANPSGFAGRSAVFSALLDGSGHLLGAYPTDRGWGYTAALGGPTLTVTGDGSGAAFNPGSASPNTGAAGGVALAAQQILSGWGTTGNYHNVTLYDAGLDGARVADFLPGGSRQAEALAMAGPPSACPVIMAEHGINDAVYGTSLATFQANLQSVATYLTGLGYTYVLNLPPGAVGLTDAQNDLLVQYRTVAIPAVIASNPAKIKLGVTQADAMASADPLDYYLSLGDLHPSVTGMPQQGANIAQALAPLLGLAPPGSTGPVTLSTADEAALTAIQADLAGVPAATVTAMKADSVLARTFSRAYQKYTYSISGHTMSLLKDDGTPLLDGGVPVTLTLTSDTATGAITAKQ